MDSLTKRSFSIRETLSEAWDLLEGTKSAIWTVAIFIGLISLLIPLLIAWFIQINPQDLPALFRYLLIPLIANTAIAPFYAGSFMVAITRARRRPIHSGLGFSYFSKTWQVMLTMFLVAVMANVIIYLAHAPFTVSALPALAGWINLFAAIVAIFVHIFFLFSIPLVVDKNYSPLGSLKASFNIIKSSWVSVLLLLIVIYGLFIVASIPMAVGSMIHPYAKLLGMAILIGALVWLVPYMFLVEGLLYHKLVD